MPDFELDRMSATPLWEQLHDQLRDAVLSGAIAPDRKLPTEQALSAELEVGRGTVARAYGLLQEDGLVVWTKGRGLFTADGATLDKVRKSRKR